MKIIFLDVDGVLNSWDQDNDSRSQLHLDKLDLLRTIVRATSPFIVLSSTWRLYKKNFRLLEHHLSSFSIVINDVTPDLSRPRQEEIAQWLTDNNIDLDSSKVAIIDDDSDACLIGNNVSFFQTRWDRGLDKDIAQEVINFLNEE